jgi:hypothetical protein
MKSSGKRSALPRNCLSAFAVADGVSAGFEPHYARASLGKRHKKLIGAPPPPE